MTPISARVFVLGALSWNAAAVAAPAQSLALDAAAFVADPDHRLLVMSLPVQELAMRIGPAEMSFTTSMTLTHQKRPLTQDDQGHLAWDSEAGLSLQLACGPMTLDVVRIGEVLFVRYNRGQMRRKSGGDMDLSPLVDQAAGTVAQALLVLEPLTLGAGEATTVEHREAVRFRLEAAETPPEGPAATPVRQVSTALGAMLPNAPRARLQQRRVSGFVVIDRATSVLLQAEIDASADIVHPAVPPTRLSCRVRHQLRHLGRREPIAAPASVPEFRRLARPRDPLAFFREPAEPSR